MNKKAESIMMMIFEILGVLLVTFIVVNIAQAYAESETTLKITAAHDIQMMVNTLVGTPGDALVEYPHNVSILTFILDVKGITIYKKGDPNLKWQVSQFYLPPGYTAEGVLEEKSTLCLEKKNKKILLRECTENEP